MLLAVLEAWPRATLLGTAACVSRAWRAAAATVIARAVTRAVASEIPNKASAPQLEQPGGYRSLRVSLVQRTPLFVAYGAPAARTAPPLPLPLPLPLVLVLPLVLALPVLPVLVLVPVPLQPVPSRAAGARCPCCAWSTVRASSRRSCSTHSSAPPRQPSRPWRACSRGTAAESS